MDTKDNHLQFNVSVKLDISLHVDVDKASYNVSVRKIC
jgi:hypothetical protein